ncbi:hypothetical protein FXE51_01470 [Vibrio mimicus]|uniref:hypothetical protein n=1 Tax=Vibrio mimicus TaxID=674 RepID=UPI0011D70114|nr:hypothetical protein [Vibrio mimicus]TXZ77080.1 hypothetical protein FXE51_01470 [Vibrio mimicus]BCN22684.1 putative O-antigen polymerase [Vibrio mimicus]
MTVRVFNTYACFLFIMVSFSCFINSNIHIPVIFICLFLICLTGDIKLDFGCKHILFLFLLLAWPYFSLLNDGGVYNAIGKSVKVFLSFLLCVIIIPHHDRPVFLLKFFLILQLIFTTISFIYFGYDSGIMNSPRYHGFYLDANYTAVILMFLILHSSFKKSIFINMVATQSATVIGTFFISKIYKKKFFSGFYFIAFVFGITSYLVANLNMDVVENTGFISERINSFIFRFMAAVQGFNFVDNFGWEGHFFGVGSGRSYEFADRVVHSYYLQTMIDHGFLFMYAWLCLMLYYSKKVNLRKDLQFSLLVISLMIDVVSTLVWPLFIFIKRNMTFPK